MALAALPAHALYRKAYDADALITHIREIGATAVIPPRANRLDQRPFDKHQYKPLRQAQDRHRNLIERFFLRIKHFRRIVTRYDKPVLSKVEGLAERFSSFIAIAAAFLWLA